MKFSTQSGVINWHSDPLNTSPSLTCSWLVEFPENDRILLKINAALSETGDDGKDCQNRNNLTTISLIFNNGSRRQVQHFCEKSLNVEFVSSFSVKYLQVIVVDSTAQHLSRYHMTLKWNILFQTNSDDADGIDGDDSSSLVDWFKCPMSKWLLPRELVCNGQIGKYLQ